MPEHGTVFDYVFEKKSSGQWLPWMDTIDKKQQQISPTAKVIFIISICFGPACVEDTSTFGPS